MSESPTLVAGTVKGTIGVWDLGAVSLSAGSLGAGMGAVGERLPSLSHRADLPPIFYGTGSSNHPVRSVSFNPHNPHQFITSTQNGNINLWDLRDPYEPIFSHKLSSEPVRERTQSV